MKKSIPEKIIEGRKRRGLTQEKLGMLLNVSPQAVSKWENAESLPDILLLPRLCQVLQISADELLEVSPGCAGTGSAKVCAAEVSLRSPQGITLTIAGAEAVQATLETDITPLQELLTDGAGLRLLRALSFTAVQDEAALARMCSLSDEDARNALLRLLRLEMCQCTPEGYALGPNAYIAFAALAAARFASPEGRAEITTITTSYST